MPCQDHTRSGRLDARGRVHAPSPPRGRVRAVVPRSRVHGSDRCSRSRRCFLAPRAHATDGHLRIIATAPGALELEHAAGWSRAVRIESGTQMIWCLPAGRTCCVSRPTLARQCADQRRAARNATTAPRSNRRGDSLGRSDDASRDRRAAEDDPLERGRRRRPRRDPAAARRSPRHAAGRSGAQARGTRHLHALAARPRARWARVDAASGAARTDRAHRARLRRGHRVALAGRPDARRLALAARARRAAGPAHDAGDRAHARSDRPRGERTAGAGAPAWRRPARYGRGPLHARPEREPARPQRARAAAQRRAIARHLG